MSSKSLAGGACKNMTGLRIVTWNVDGLRAMLQRRQESLASVLHKLEAGVLCAVIDKPV